MQNNITNNSNLLHSLASMAGNEPYLKNPGNTPSQPGSTHSTRGGNDSSYAVKLSEQGQVRATLSKLQTTLDELARANAAAAVTAASSVPSVVNAQVKDNTAPAGDYTVNVRRLAQAQTLVSAPVPNADKAAQGGGTLRIETGKYAADSRTFTPAGEARQIEINARNSTLKDIAEAINTADAGIKAEVVKQPDGAAQLRITNAQTGEGNTVRIAVTRHNGNELAKLNFDPAAHTGNGLKEGVAAQNAVISVNHRLVTSQTNEVRGAIPGVTLRLEQPGSATVSVERTPRKDLPAAAQRIVDVYNTLRTTVAPQVPAGTPPTTAPLQSTAGSAGNEPTAASHYGLDLPALATLGISPTADGKLAIDHSTLTNAIQRREEHALNQLAAAARKLSDAVAKAAQKSSQAEPPQEPPAPPQATIPSPFNPVPAHSLFDSGPSLTARARLRETDLYTTVSRL